MNADAVRQLATVELATRSRFAYVALGLVSTLMTIALASLWLTEPTLPTRAHVAFAAMVVIGLSWSAYAVWVLTSRRILLAPHRVIAGRMAVTFTAAFVVGALLLGSTGAGSGAFIAAAIGAVMLAVAIASLVREQRAWAALKHRRDSLERELGPSAGGGHR